MFTTTITALAATLLFARTHAVPEGFVISDVSPGKDFKVPVQMMFLDRERALVLEKSGKIVISQPNRPGFPKETYPALEDVYKTTSNRENVNRVLSGVVIDIY